MSPILLAGVDEAGRGPLVGSVFAAAVILPERYDLPGLTDSKKLSEKKRDALAVLIKEQAVVWSVALRVARRNRRTQYPARHHAGDDPHCPGFGGRAG